MNASSSITLSRWWSISSEPYPKTCSLTIPEGRTGLHPVWEGVLGVRTTWKKKENISYHNTGWAVWQATQFLKSTSGLPNAQRWADTTAGGGQQSAHWMGHRDDAQSVCGWENEQEDSCQASLSLHSQQFQGLAQPISSRASVIRWTLEGTQTFPRLEEKGHGRTEYGQGQRERGGSWRPGHSLSEQVVEIGIQPPKQEWWWWWFSR